MPILIVDSAGLSGPDEDNNFIYTVLNDAFSPNIDIAPGNPPAPFTGSFQPHNPLFPLNGLSVAGSWRLRIEDTATGDTGFLRAWGLEMCTLFNKVYLPVIVR
jgi:hypothetical protein